MGAVFDFNTHPLTSKLKRVVSAGPNKWLASCPCGRNHEHNDQKRSLSVEYDPDTEKLLVYCFTGCSVTEICSEVGCSLSDLFFKRDPSGLINWYANKYNMTPVETYSYCYGSYNDGLCKVRFRKQNGSKDFRWIHEDTNKRGGFGTGHSGTHRLYVAGSMERDSVVLAEGEKDANTIHCLINATAVSAENGASRNTGGKWLEEYNQQLAGKKVYILFDNDDVGRQFAHIEAQQIAQVAAGVFLLDLPKAWPDCPAKGDITDYVKAAGQEKAAQLLTGLISSAEPYKAPDPDPQEVEAESSDAPVESAEPEWLFTVVTRNGEMKKINEPVFCDCFKAKHHLVKINGVFYFDGYSVSDDFILNEIQKLIQEHFIERVGILTGNIFKTLSNACFITQPEPDERKVYCADFTTLTIGGNGEISQGKEDIFTLTRIPVVYDPEASCPTFENYLKDVFFEEDIPAIQEFVGYCLVPTTRAQAGLFIHGKGGEGKSVFRDVLMRLFGHTIKQESISNLDKQFVFANLENILVCIDDDMEVSLMGETSMLKKIITSKGLQQVERKHMQKHDAFIFARIIGIGNSFIGSKFDQSDGFYRRCLLIDCKPKTREKDDRFMSDKCTAEIQGVLNWALVGLCRLVGNGYNFTISERMQETLDSIRRENDSVLTFIENNIEETNNRNDFISSAELVTAYGLDCHDNGDTPVKKKTFQTRIAERYREHKDRQTILLPSKGNNPERRKVNGYWGIKFKDPKVGLDMRARLANTDYREENFIDRMQ